jgi:hypothetical protein
VCGLVNRQRHEDYPESDDAGNNVQGKREGYGNIADLSRIYAWLRH